MAAAVNQLKEADSWYCSKQSRDPCDWLPKSCRLWTGMVTTHTHTLVGDQHFRSAVSNPNGLLSQKLCQLFNQGCTLNDILTLCCPASFGDFHLKKNNRIARGFAHT